MSFNHQLRARKGGGDALAPGAAFESGRVVEHDGHFWNDADRLRKSDPEFAINFGADHLGGKR